MSEYVIETDDLTRYFGTKPAVQGLSLRVPRGGVFALLGRNGSGKTTTIRMLLGFLEPTRGTATVLGTPSNELTPDIRARIGYVGENHFLYRWMTVDECAGFQAGCFPNWNQKIFETVLEHFRLNRKANTSKLSRGEKAGVCLGLTLATEPELLILDDPALGLDPVARRALIEAMLAVTRDSNRTILFSSHFLDDVERVADHIAILDHSTLQVCCSVDQFRENIGQWSLSFADGQFPESYKINQIPGLVRQTRIESGLKLTIANAGSNFEADLKSLGATAVNKIPLSLDQAVIDYLTDSQVENSLLHTVGDELAKKLQDVVTPSAETAV